MKLFLLTIVLILTGINGYSTTHTITNSGTAFNPASITITVGDDVNFSLENIHNAIEVSQSTWNVNGTTALPGGFQTPFGGGLVQPSQLGVGTHYYICGPHVSFGMKGIIIVQNATGIENNDSQPDISVYPNPAIDLITIKANSNYPGSEYFITDQTGRKVFVGKLNDATTPVDISQFTKGIYFIQVTGQRKTPVKVIKN